MEFSAAAKAGIKKEDEILSIDGKDVKSRDLSRVKEMLIGEGRMVKISIKSRYCECNLWLLLNELI